MLDLLVIPFLAFLNRFRGGGFGADRLPGHPRFYVAPVVGGLAFLVTWSPISAALFAACYLFWSLIPWGHAIGLGHWTPARDPAPLEEALIHWTANPYLRLLSIEVFGMLPLLLVVGPLSLLAPPAMVACYALGWGLRPKAPIELAEVLGGVVWAVLLLSL